VFSHLHTTDESPTTFAPKRRPPKPKYDVSLIQLLAIPNRQISGQNQKRRKTPPEGGTARGQLDCPGGQTRPQAFTFQVNMTSPLRTDHPDQPISSRSPGLLRITPWRLTCSSLLQSGPKSPPTCSRVGLVQVRRATSPTLLQRRSASRGGLGFNEQAALHHFVKVSARLSRKGAEGTERHSVQTMTNEAECGLHQPQAGQLRYD